MTIEETSTVQNHVRLNLPQRVADDLISDRTGVRVLRTRGGGLTDAVTIAVESINTGSAAVSVVVAAATCRRLAQAFIRHRRPADPNRASVRITIGDRSELLEVDLTDPGAEDLLFDFFVEAINAKQVGS
ncbi:hypothetical protein N802_11700 [Knoellia sinensis KCTC 19936]|uniref:Uncharacterized protein n=1 Tax=Knoellia sinensis KCTC 19936 TaxID=1385520 RepID=A0A0A0J1W4_9MICO|nr:hypothetical protein [Knoellia sinensis]KGN29631.1 hypothetical protein N802_11700 [Knoellia sinensis KCTC 19936]